MECACCTRCLTDQGCPTDKCYLRCVYLLLLRKQMQAWQEEVERARQSQREAEAKISSLEVTLISSLNQRFSIFFKIVLYCWMCLASFSICSWDYQSLFSWSALLRVLFCNYALHVTAPLFSLVQAELQKMRVEMAGMRRDAEHYSRQVKYLLLCCLCYFSWHNQVLQI